MDKCKENSNHLCVLVTEKKEDITPPSLQYPLLTVTVPKEPAQTKEQFLKERALWPVTFHPRTPPPDLTDLELKHYAIGMTRAIEIGREAKKQGNAPVGMVVLDKEGNILSECGDCRKDMFLDHCCFAGIRKLCEKQMKRSRNREKMEDPYLLNDYDVVITREPCIMCCMCLLHSRVRRVVYGCDDPNGGFNTNVHLHYVKQLNHHFRVFRGLLEEECADLWSGSSFCYVYSYFLKT